MGGRGPWNTRLVAGRGLLEDPCRVRGPLGVEDQVVESLGWVGRGNRSGGHPHLEEIPDAPLSCSVQNFKCVECHL